MNSGGRNLIPLVWQLCPWYNPEQCVFQEHIRLSEFCEISSNLWFFNLFQSYKFIKHQFVDIFWSVFFDISGCKTTGSLVKVARPLLRLLSEVCRVHRFGQQVTPSNVLEAQASHQLSPGEVKCHEDISDIKTKKKNTVKSHRLSNSLEVNDSGKRMGFVDCRKSDLIIRPAISWDQASIKTRKNIIRRTGSDSDGTKPESIFCSLHRNHLGLTYFNNLHPWVFLCNLYTFAQGLTCTAQQNYTLRDIYIYIYINQVSKAESGNHASARVIGYIIW